MFSKSRYTKESIEDIKKDFFMNLKNWKKFQNVINLKKIVKI